MRLSPDKTNCVTVANKRGRKENGTCDRIHLNVNGTPIQRTDSVKILGVTFQEDGRASKWYRGIKNHWKATLGKIKFVTSKSWGAQEHTLKKLVRALLISKTTYGINYLRLNNEQRKGLEVLNRMAMRVVTGLPKSTKIEELETIAGMNCLRDIAQEDKISQVLRLQKTTAGRNILMKLDIECPDTPISIPPPPWEDEIVVDTKPLPQNLSKEEMGRRKTAAKKHNYDLQKLLEDPETDIYYTDASKVQSQVAIAAHRFRDQFTVTRTLKPRTGVKQAELMAIQLAIETAAFSPSKKIYIYTDAKKAFEEYRNPSSRSKTVQTVKAIARIYRSEGKRVTIRWIPGHQEIPGNDAADAAARVSLPPHQLPGLGTDFDDVQKLNTGSPIQPEGEEEVDPLALKAVERQARRERLGSLLREDPHPLPADNYTRWEKICLRRLRTHTAMVPKRTAIFKKSRLTTKQHDTEIQDSQAGPSTLPMNESLCEYCEETASETHVFWDCPRTQETRRKALEALPHHMRPHSLQEWVLPTGSPEHRKATLDSLLTYVKEAKLTQFIENKS
ncbi:uncharacterized protein LOC120850234 [Ixodes scapularis]|uniref:uncharacterized protein LOC120850234 n=1 Tax=Ixodes scapularis TaxID=6945 RepID=UPI001A9F0F05|nr:uncharacterized protein LOC120850234 [Ixodes scapularis]